MQTVERKQRAVSLRKAVGGGYYDFWHWRGRYRVVKGSRRSKKSKTIALWIISMMMKPGYELANSVVVRKVKDTLRDSCYTELKWAIDRLGVGDQWRIRISPMEMERISTGQKILFRGLDSAQKLSSITVPHGVLCWLWCEEAFEIATEEEFDTIIEGLMGALPPPLFRQVTLSFNPWHQNHWLKRRFFDTSSPDVLAVSTTYHCNEWLSEDDKQEFERIRMENPLRYAVVGLAEWGTSGASIFSELHIAEQLAKKTKPIRIARYDVDRDDLVDDPKGWLKVYSKPQAGVPYVIGADTAGSGSDWIAAHVIDNRTGQQVAVLHRQVIAEHEFVSQLMRLGYYYNTALIAIESNFSTYSTTTMQERGYPRQYVRKREDTFTRKTVDAYGFLTTGGNRERIISQLVSVMDSTPELVIDEDTLYEMQTMVRDEKGKAQAEEGAHDDLVLALSIAHEARSQQRYYIDEAAAPLVSYKEMETWNLRQKELWRTTPDMAKPALLERWKIEKEYARAK